MLLIRVTINITTIMGKINRILWVRIRYTKSESGIEAVQLLSPI